MLVNVQELSLKQYLAAAARRHQVRLYAESVVPKLDLVSILSRLSKQLI